MISCRLLYSKADVERFLEFPRKQECEILATEMDAQLVFIVRFLNLETQKAFDDFIEYPDPTLIGCIEYMSDKVHQVSISYLERFTSFTEPEDLCCRVDEVDAM